jgi:hypothetical protein
MRKRKDRTGRGVIGREPTFFEFVPNHFLELESTAADFDFQWL